MYICNKTISNKFIHISILNILKVVKVNYSIVEILRKLLIQTKTKVEFLSLLIFYNWNEKVRRSILCCEINKTYNSLFFS